MIIGPKELDCFSIDRGSSLIIAVFFFELALAFLSVGPLLSGLVLGSLCSCP